MTSRLLAPAGACVGVDVGPRRYNGNIVTPANRTDAALLKAAGYTDAGPGGVARARGFVCTGCGFHAFFSTCGRCGSPAVRDTEPAPAGT